MKNGQVVNADGPRWIERSSGKPTDVTSCDAEDILAAITRGTQVNCFVQVRKNLSPFDEPDRETCLTVFLCPILGVGRYAVEVWAGSKKWTRDFKSEADAVVYQRAERYRLEI
jgi:hypothetical protein